MQRDENLNEEIQAHLEIETQQLMDQRGCSREEAEALARRSFGNRTQVAEVTRQMWGFSGLNEAGKISVMRCEYSVTAPDSASP